MYSKLDQHIFPRQLNSKRPLQINRGTTTSGNKYIYFGQLEEGTNNEDGVGIRVNSNGNISEGYWKNGNQNRLGRCIYDGGDYYIGEFKDSKRHGQGTYWWANGKKYVGESKNGKWDGQGIIYYTDGTKYVGDWKDENKHGKGTEYTANGQISREGVWADDKYVGKG